MDRVRSSSWRRLPTSRARSARGCRASRRRRTRQSSHRRDVGPPPRRRSQRRAESADADARWPPETLLRGLSMIASSSPTPTSCCVAASSCKARRSPIGIARSWRQSSGCCTTWNMRRRPALPSVTSTFRLAVGRGAGRAARRSDSADRLGRRRPRQGDAVGGDRRSADHGRPTDPR